MRGDEKAEENNTKFLKLTQIIDDLGKTLRIYLLRLLNLF